MYPRDLSAVLAPPLNQSAEVNVGRAFKRARVRTAAGEAAILPLDPPTHDTRGEGEIGKRLISEMGPAGARI